MLVSLERSSMLFIIYVTSIEYQWWNVYVYVLTLF